MRAVGCVQGFAATVMKPRGFCYINRNIRNNNLRQVPWDWWYHFPARRTLETLCIDANPTCNRLKYSNHPGLERLYARVILNG